MESKYYAPDISEFHVGFEYEHCHSSVRFVMLNLKTGEESDATESKEIWEKSIFSGNEFDIWKSSFKFDDSLRDGQIRVKYLDREDIESLGFKKYYPNQNYNYDYWYNGILLRSNNFVEFSIQCDEKPYAQLFKGVIKNKSELKQVLKMIGVSYE